MPRYELVEGTSSKFWQIDLEGTSFTTTYGKIGTNGQSTTKSFADDAKAKHEHDKLVAEKTKKGYSLVGDSESTAGGTVPAAAVTAPTTPVVKPAAPVEKVAAPVEAQNRALTPALERRARTERKSLDVDKLEQPRDAVAAFKRVRESYVGGPRKRIEDGVSKSGAHGAAHKSITRTYNFETLVDPPDVDREAFAFILMAPMLKLNWPKLAIGFWLAHGGWDFALEAYARVVGSVQADTDHHLGAGLGPMYLVEVPDRPPHARLIMRLDTTMREYLLGATDDERAAARKKAEAMRGERDLVVKSALSAVFLDPHWIDADLRERAKTGAAAVVTESMLLDAATPEAVVAFFDVMTATEAELYEQKRWGHTHSDPFMAALAAETREPDALAAFAARLAELATPQYGSEVTFGPMVLDAFEILGCALNAPSVVRAAIRLLNKWHDYKVNKGSDARPNATYALLRAPAIALPLVRDAAIRREAWAKELLPKLEPLESGASKVDEASASELPEVFTTVQKFAPSSFWIPDAFARPVLASSGKGLPIEAMNVMAAIVKNDDKAGIAAVKEACTSASLGAFAWDLFHAWLTAGAVAKEKWAFLAMGHWGNDACARKLTPLVRAWPGEAAHARATIGLDVLAEIGSDVALMMLNGIAQKLKFKGLQDKAREKMDDIAKRRGFTAEELEDRLVPDMDLEDDGSKTLDFGPRSFRVGFDETLSPYVMDASGARLKDLPKPSTKDDGAIAGLAVESWKQMKKDARALSSIQILRLELAMANERRWPEDAFRAFFVEHPLMVHLVRRLIWGAFDESNKLVSTFRVAEDRSYASKDDEAYAFPEGHRVGLVHRMRMTDDDAMAWSRVLGDYELAQPFEQLQRDVYRLGADEFNNLLVSRFMGRIVESKRILGLVSRGWRRGSAQDNGSIFTAYKPLARDLAATLSFMDGLNAGGMEYADPTQTLEGIDFGPGEGGSYYGQRQNAVAPTAISEVVMSEIIRDVESLGQVEEKT